ncbi:MAG TPA: branched-chain amino acid ABC transporter permease [Anaerolineae bacterium]|nr:branched-chain amino acid ABC transporter permease [Anaerolineae bacterium]
MTPQGSFLKRNLSFLLVVGALAALPFVLALLNGQSIADLLANKAGESKFIQGLLIEIFILAVFAISYDLVLGITGLLSFGHGMFFAFGAYLSGILLKSFGWPLWQVLIGIVVLGVLQALLFAIVLPRVKGITFALVTLGIAAVFDILVKSQELNKYTGADVGLQGVPRPAGLSPVDDRLRFYFIALIFAVVVYLIYKRFVDSPTGRVCIATRENENRALSIGCNTFYFKLAALIVASITAALAGTLHTLYKPLVSPEIAGLGFTVQGLLMLLIGGIGTLSGAMVGAAVLRLMEFYFSRWFGESAGFVIGMVYVLIVLFLPYGIVGTWRLRRLDILAGRRRLLELFQLSKPTPGDAGQQ